MPKPNNIDAQLVHRKVSASRKCFVMDSLRHVTFGYDLQSSFEENAKEMRYCNAKLNVIADVLRDEEGGLNKSITNC